MTNESVVNKTLIAKGESDTGEYLSILADIFGYDDYDETQNNDIIYPITTLGKHTIIYWTFMQIADYVFNRLPDEATAEEVIAVLNNLMPDEKTGFKRSESNLKNLDYLWQTDYNKLPPVAKVVASYITDVWFSDFEGYELTNTVDDIKADFLAYCDAYEDNEGEVRVTGWSDFQDLMQYENYDNPITDDNDNIITMNNFHHLFIRLLNEVGFYQYTNNSKLDDVKDFCKYLKTQSLLYKDKK